MQCEHTCALVREQRPAHHLVVMYVGRIVWSAHIDQAGVVSFSQVVQHRGFIEAGEVSHVLHFTEARGVHPLHLLPGQSDPPLAVCQLNLHFIATLLPNTGRLGGRVEGERRLAKREEESVPVTEVR